MKYKRILSMFAWVAAMAVTISCADNDVEEPGLTGRENIIMDVVTDDDQVQTRASSPGIDALNENRIDRLDFFFYDNIMGTNNAKFHIRVTPSTTWEYRLRREVSNSALASLFPNGLEASVGTTSVSVFVIANAPTDVDFDEMEDTRVATLRKVAISAPFQPHGTGSTKQDNFVMDGFHSATLVQTDGKYRLVVEKEQPILLIRAAAKIDLVIRSLKDVVEDTGGNEWVPDTTGIKIGFYHGVKNSYVNTDAEAFPVTSDDQFDYSHKENNAKKMHQYSVTVGQGEDEVTYLNYKHLEPFYSYTTEWEGDTEGEVDAGKEVYLTLMVPWKLNKPDVTAYTNTYYQIPVNKNGKKLGRNVYYRIELNVGILGSFTEQEEVPLDSNTYLVLKQLDWNQEIKLDADVLDTRYLALKYDTVYMSNATQGVAEYITSHSSTARVDTVKWFDYSAKNIRLAVVTRDHPNRIYYYTKSNNGQWTTPTTPAYTTQTGVYGTYSIEAKTDGTIELTHSLDEMYSPQTICATVYHTDKQTVSERVWFIQYPPIYITGNISNGYTFVNRTSNHETTGWTNSNSVGHYKSVADNNNYNIGTITHYDDAAGVNMTGNNTNPNIYAIHISSFSNNDYKIGDPRIKVTDVTNLGLTNYYATNPTGTKDIIAPEFIIASSYGKTQYRGNYPIDLPRARKRCAAYQEDGYPAGRWRLPTFAEVKFIMQLSTQGTIPTLFNMVTPTDTEGYWCANGKVVLRNNVVQLEESNYSTQYTAPRCIYDVWYWGEEHSQYATTWHLGDND